MKHSAKRAVDRMKAERSAAVHRLMGSDAYDPERTINDLENDIQRLAKENAMLQQQLIEAQASNANWRVQCGELINQNDDLRAQPVEADK